VKLVVALPAGREPPQAVRVSLEQLAAQLGISVFRIEDPASGSVTFEVRSNRDPQVRARFEVSRIEQAQLNSERLGQLVAERLAATADAVNARVHLGEDAARFVDGLRLALGPDWTIEGYRRVERTLVVARLGAAVETRIEFGPEDLSDPPAAADRIRVEVARRLGV
jgi:hypothetical protein